MDFFQVLPAASAWRAPTSGEGDRSTSIIPTSANREDHVPMSTAAARKSRAVVANATRVLAGELLCAAQGLEFLRPLRPGQGAEGPLTPAP